MTNTQRRVGFLVSAVTAWLLAGCASDSTKLGDLPGGGGQPGTDAASPDGPVQGTGGARATGGASGTGGVLSGTGGGIMGSGGTTGSGGVTTTGTMCPLVAACNWCGGQALHDSQGCITGWRCANGVNPCVVFACSASSPCKAGEICGPDQLCWPAGGTGGTGGKSGTGGIRGTGGSGGGGTGGTTGIPIKLCGSIAGVPCQSGEFCEFSAEGCRIMDAIGVCTQIPTVCPTLYQPVCGCDGKTYDNDCVREVARMSKIADGACGSTTDGGVAAATLTIEPKSAKFEEGIGLTSAPVVFTVMNTSSVPSEDVSGLLTGATTPDAFIVTNTTCSAFLPAGHTCQVSVIFKAPTTSGNYSATLEIRMSRATALSAPLSGYAFPPPGGDAGATDTANAAECPTSLPSSGSACNAPSNIWCNYLVADPLNQYSCVCSSSLWSCAIASP